MTTRPRAVVEELFTARFEAIAREMGELLRRTALSTNVKERLDFSCALLDPAGELVVNAPHIPVHLGALGLCVRRVAEALELAPGDVVVTNSPAFGGSHLPDVTVVARCSGRRAGALLGYVANRAHHAEIGGTRPGSMPPDATWLAEEGVVIPPTRVLEAARPAGSGCARCSPRRRSRAATSRRTWRTWRRRWRPTTAGRKRSARSSRATGGRRWSNRWAASPGGRRTGWKRRCAARRRRLPGAGALDDGAPLAVTVTVAGGRATISFDGSAPVHPGNLNATPAVVRSAVLYVLRLLVGEPLPLNEGLLRPVELSIPPGMLAPSFPDDPRRAPAVVGGNVETSQRLVDTLIKALGLAACSQGTMNNVLFGNDRFGYYETVCGGGGARPRRAGPRRSTPT